MNTTNEEITRKQLVELLTKPQAHVTFDEAIENIQMANLGLKPNNLPYSIWQLVEHIRITQWDILDFSRNPNYKAINWPEDYWLKEAAPASEAAWSLSIAQIHSDLNEFISLLNDPATDLYKPFAHGDGQTLLREAMLIADHTAYHTGEIVLIRRLLNDWR